MPPSSPPLPPPPPVSTVPLLLWLVASDVNGTAGDGVDAWPDRAGGAGMLVKDSRPTPELADYIDAAGKAHRVVRFGGANVSDSTATCLTGANVFSNQSDGLEVWLVVRARSHDHTKAYVFDFGSNGGNGYGLVYSRNKYETYASIQQGGAKLSGDLPAGDGYPMVVLRLRVAFGDEMRYELDGTPVDSASITLSGLTADQINQCSAGANCGQFTLGRQSKNSGLSSDDGRWFRGDIAEVRVYDGLLSSAEADELLGWLISGYKAALPPPPSSPP